MSAEMTLESQNNVVFMLEKKPSSVTRVFLDYDADSSWLWRTDPLWDNLLELVRMEALRLGRMYPLGDIAVIMRADNGYHIRFPKARLTKEQELSVMWSSLSHFGHKWFSSLVEDTTLRVSKKPDKNSHRPYLVEVIKIRGEPLEERTEKNG